jgi:Mannosyltransferase OCH1 and related enzymes
LLSSKNVIGSLDKLYNIFNSDKRVNFYGAGVRLGLFFQTMDECKMTVRANRILVSSAKGNPEQIRGIPVVGFSPELLTKEDIVLLTLSECYVEEVEKMLAYTEAQIYRIDFDIIDDIPSSEIRNCIAPFTKKFETDFSQWNIPNEKYTRCAWTMWWQGENVAPDIVRICWKTQKENLPHGVKHKIITKDNFREYIDIPKYVLDKYEKGYIMPAHLSDIVRCCLLYKYGGIWLDSTILMCELMPEECMQYPIYTRTTVGREFNSKAVWAIWFLCARKGEKLFRFVMDAYFYYFQHYDKVKYYLMTDYLIGIACNMFPDICKKLNKIPYNNIGAMELGKHLEESYNEQDYRKYTKNTFIQKLTWHGNLYAENSIYSHIIRTYGGIEN